MKRTPEQQLAAAEAVALREPEDECQHEETESFVCLSCGKDTHHGARQPIESGFDAPDDGPINIPALDAAQARRWGAGRYLDGGGE